MTELLTGIGLFIAWQGLVVWKKRIKGSEEFETAHNLHLAILKLREAVYLNYRSRL